MDGYGWLPWWPSFQTTGGRVRVRPPVPPTAWRTSRSSWGRLAVPSPWNTTDVGSYHRNTLPLISINHPHTTAAGLFIKKCRWKMNGTHAIWTAHRWQHIQLIGEIKKPSGLSTKITQRQQELLRTKVKELLFSQWDLEFTTTVKSYD